jgi:DNA-directed RNA polymerase subunit M/transcription elongation factor TFIIS
MSGIVLRTQADGVGHRNAYVRYFKHKEKVKDQYGIERTVSTRMQQDMPACETVIFKCPAPKCGAKNEQSVLRSKGAAGESLSFECRKCGREIEVSKPAEQPKIIVPGIEKPKHMGLVGADGRPLAR